MSQYTQLEQSMNTPYQHTLITIFNNPPSTPILPGDSCFPAITTDDTTSIFEEQEVVNSLADLVGGTEGDVGSKLDKLAVGKVIYAEKEKILAFGPIMCGQPGTRGINSFYQCSMFNAPLSLHLIAYPSTQPHQLILPRAPTNTPINHPGVMERIKISNPTKIDCKVKFRVAASDEGVDVNKDAAAAPAAAAAGKGDNGKDSINTFANTLLMRLVYP